MKEHHHNNHGNGHHRRSSAHIEHVNILDQLGNSLKDELKRGLGLIDSSVNQLAQAKWILINIEKTLAESYKDCPACHEYKSKSSPGSSPVKSKHSDQGSIKKEERRSSEEITRYEKPVPSAKPGPKSKTKIKSPSPVRNVVNTKVHQPPCNYSRDKAMSSKKIIEKDKPLVKLSDISNVIKGRRRVHLSDFPALQGPKKKRRKISVSNEEASDSESCTYASTKKRKHKSPTKKFKSREIIESDMDSSSEEERVSISEMLKKKKHKHNKHEKHHKHHSKSKVKEFGGRSNFFDKITLAKSDVTDKTDRSDSIKISKSEKSHSAKEKSLDNSELEKITPTRSDETDDTDKSDIAKPTKSSKEIKKVDRDEKDCSESKSPVKENKSPSKENRATEKEKSVQRDDSDKQSRKEEKEKVDIKAMLLSKAKPDLIKQRLLEKFKQFTAARKVTPGAKEKENSGETDEMDTIGLKVEKQKAKNTFEGSILDSIKTPTLQDMIEEDERNEKRSNSLDSVDEFIQSVLHNNNDAVTEKEIIKILKKTYPLDEDMTAVELKAETQIKIKEAIGQFQTVIVAHLQGGGTDTAGNKADSGSEGSPNSERTPNAEAAQRSSDGNTITNNEQGNIVILNDSQLPSGELTIGNYFLIGREGYPLQLMKYVGGNNFEPLQMSNFTPQQLSVMKNSLL